MLFESLSAILHKQYLELRKLSLPDAQKMAADVFEWELEAARLEDLADDAEDARTREGVADAELLEANEEIKNLKEELRVANAKVDALEEQIAAMEDAAT